MTRHRVNRLSLRTSLGFAIGLFGLMSTVDCGGQQAGRSAPPMPVVTVATLVNQRIVEWDVASNRLNSSKSALV